MSHNQEHKDGLTIRPSRASDAAAVRRVADRDSAPVPAEPQVVAEVGGEIRAAMSVTDGSVIADPFHPTSELVGILRAYAGPVRREAHSPPTGALRFERSRRPRLAFRSAD